MGCIKDFVLSVWEERKVRLYGEHANVHQSHSQNDSGDLRGVAGGDGELGCLCDKAGTSHLCDGSAHSSGCVVNGYGCRLSYYYFTIAEYTVLDHMNRVASVIATRGLDFKLKEGLSAETSGQCPSNVHILASKGIALDYCE